MGAKFLESLSIWRCHCFITYLRLELHIKNSPPSPIIWRSDFIVFWQLVLPLRNLMTFLQSVLLTSFFWSLETFKIYSLSSLKIGEGDSNPLQYSCLENPMDRGAWYSPWSRMESHRVGMTEVTEQGQRCMPICLAAYVNCVGQLMDPFSYRLISESCGISANYLFNNFLLSIFCGSFIQKFLIRLSNSCIKSVSLYFLFSICFCSAF